MEQIRIGKGYVEQVGGGIWALKLNSLPGRRWAAASGSDLSRS